MVRKTETDGPGLQLVLRCGHTARSPCGEGQEGDDREATHSDLRPGAMHTHVRDSDQPGPQSQNRLSLITQELALGNLSNSFDFSKRD